MNCINILCVCTLGATVHVFVPNRHGTDTSERLQRCTAVHKCGVYSVNMANVKACFTVQNLKLEVGIPPGPFSLRLGAHVCSSRERNCLCVDWWIANCMANDNRKVIIKMGKAIGYAMQMATHRTCLKTPHPDCSWRAGCRPTWLTPPSVCECVN